MIWLIIILLFAIILFWIYRFHIYSLLIYLSVKFEHRPKDFQLLSSLRESLVHERKKKIAGLEMILSSWERGDEIQPKYEYFEELLSQLRELVREERRNLMTVTKDIFLWGKLWKMLRRIEKKKSREKRDLRNELKQIQNLLDQVIDKATELFSFTLNQVVAESVKIVRVEKSQVKSIVIQEQLDEVGNIIRFSYDRLKDWQRILTNLIRNAVDAVEMKQSGEGVAADFSLREGKPNLWVRVSTKEAEGSQAGMPDSPGSSVSVIIEDSGIGMDEVTRTSFYKKGFTLGKKGGLGLGVSEESVQLINKYGNWHVESQKGVGTTITINIDKQKAQKAELILPPPKPFYRTKLAYGLFVLALALTGLTLLFTFDKYSRFWEDWNPASAKLIDENTVVVEAADGRFLWDRSFTQSIRETCLVVADIDRDGKDEVLIGTNSGPRETGNLFCFSSRGKELWRFTLGADRLFQVTSNRYKCWRIIARDLDSDGETEILVEADNTPWFPHQIALLDRRGRLQRSYWHSGAVSFLVCEDLDDDGIEDIVFGGVNNRLEYSAVLGVLDNRKMWGQSPPYRDTSLAKAKEKIYVKFPFVRELGGENDRYSTVVAFMYAGRQNGSDAYHVTITDDPGFQREYHLDEGLTHVKDIVVHPDYRFAWERMKREGMVDYDISPEVLESWKKIEVWKNGVKVK